MEHGSQQVMVATVIAKFPGTIADPPTVAARLQILSTFSRVYHRHIIMAGHMIPSIHWDVFIPKQR